MIHDTRCISNETPVTVFIHGTSQTTNYYSWLIPPLHNVCEQNLRSPFGFLAHAQLPEQHGFRELARILCEKMPDHFHLQPFYFYGWSGKLSNSAREKAASDLFDILVTLPGKKTLITHSHGGNVALNLAKIAEQRNVPLSIEKLILLACPVQDITEKYVKSSVFKQIYSFYSPADLFQVGDPQGIHVKHGNNWPRTTLFSRREFNDESVIQVKVKRNGRTLTHLNYIRPSFFNELPDILKILMGTERELLPRTKGGSYCINLKSLKKRKQKS